MVNGRILPTVTNLVTEYERVAGETDLIFPAQNKQTNKNKSIEFNAIG